jgi:hypothetical protein
VPNSKFEIGAAVQAAASNNPNGTESERSALRLTQGL